MDFLSGDLSEFRSRVKSAFADVELPRDGNIVFETYDDEGVEAMFSSAQRYDFTVDQLAMKYVAPCFFTIDAFRHFLPAFLLAAMGMDDDAETIKSALISRFAGSVSLEHTNNIIASLNEEQLSVVRDFFDMCVNSDKAQAPDVVLPFATSCERALATLDDALKLGKQPRAKEE